MEEGQAALAEAQARVDRLQAERDRFGTLPDTDTLQRAQAQVNQLNALQISRKQAESQLEEGPPGGGGGLDGRSGPPVLRPDPGAGLAAGQR